MFISEVETTLLVVIMTLLLLDQIKSAEISNFIPFRSIFIFTICTLDCIMTLSILFVLVGMMIYFLDGPLVVMFSLGFSLLLELDMIL